MGAHAQHEHWLRLTKFFGKLFLINFAIGVVTGIVQEFQFGMNWSDYSRFVGDIFGAPLAIEGLLAFFLESTFLGLWIFGWDRLPARLHAGCIWVVHVGTLLSAYFILAANSWMQHPVGYSYNPDTGRAELNDFAAVLFNKVQLVTFPHTVLAAYLTGARVHARRRAVADGPPHDAGRGPRRCTARRSGSASVVLLVAGLGVAVSGDFQGKVMTEVQPMKMAAAEALYDTEQPAAFSIFTIGSLDGVQEKFSVKVPGLLSFLATGTLGRPRWRASTSCARSTAQTYGAGPGRGVLLRRGLHAGHPGDLLDLPADDRARRRGRRRCRARAVASPGAAACRPAAAGCGSRSRCRCCRSRANSFGWIFTEMGRQPWVVFGLMTTANAVSPGVSVGEVLTSLVTLTLLYAVLAVVEVGLMLQVRRAGRGPVRRAARPRARRARATGRSPSPTDPRLTRPRRTPWN